MRSNSKFLQTKVEISRAKLLKLTNGGNIQCVLASTFKTRTATVLIIYTKVANGFGEKWIADSAPESYVYKYSNNVHNQII